MICWILDLVTEIDTARQVLADRRTDVIIKPVRSKPCRQLVIVNHSSDRTIDTQLGIGSDVDADVAHHTPVQSIVQTKILASYVTSHLAKTTKNVDCPQNKATENDVG